MERSEGVGVILCVSANPALDVRLRVPRLAAGGVQRTSSAERLAGGKAVHVALAARALGEPATLVGWFGGTTGARCQKQLRELGLPTVPLRTRCETRQNLEILDEQGSSTELLEPGGTVKPREVTRFCLTCDKLIAQLGAADAVVLCGSLPAGAPPDLFARIVASARRRGVLTFVDTSGAALEATLSAGPDCIKPNHEEAGALLGWSVDDARSASEAARALRSLGAGTVAISRGHAGLVAAGAAGAFEVRGPAVTARSSVGCGDAAVAGLAVATLRGASLLDAIKLAVACGYANCHAAAPGRLSPDLVREALGRVAVTMPARGAA